MANKHKTVTVHVRMTDAEHALLKRKSGGKMSPWLRHAWLETAMIDDPSARETLLAIQAELVAQGRNLNQIARRINSGGDSHGLHDAIAETATVRKLVTKALSQVI